MSTWVAAVTARRVARPGWRAPVPVICCGNAGVGGAGKTTLVLDLAARLVQRGLNVHLLTRGYGGTARGPLRVDPARHTAREVGDEALLLAARAPTWLGADRAVSARAAVAAGAQALLMDDGMQNPTLMKTASLLLIDGAAGFGNGRVMPAGPLREPVHAAARRATAAILIGQDACCASAQLPSGLPVLRARLVPAPDMAALSGQRVVAFAGIGRPAKFFTTLSEAGVVVVRRIPFPDHHRFRPAELADMAALSRTLEAVTVTTQKDLVRIPVAERTGVQGLGVSLVWEDEAALAAMLDRVMDE